MKTKIIASVTQLPDYEHKNEDVIPYLKSWLSNESQTVQRSAIKIYESTDIVKRHSALPLEKTFSDMSFEEKNNLYIEAAKTLGKKALLKGLDAAGLKPTDIDFIITTSCTGFMIPSLDAYLINALEMKNNIKRLPVTEMGCAGGTSALIYAEHFSKAYPDKNIAIVSVELPSINLQKNDLSMENLVSSAIFADGSSCVILGPTNKLAPTIKASNMYHFPHSTHLMGYNLTNSGFKIILDRDIPNSIATKIDSIIAGFLGDNNKTIDQMKYFMIHPGGKKIINAVDQYLKPYGKNVEISKKVLRENGNLSSSTVLFILSEHLKMESAVGDQAYMLAFGPGFSAQSLLLEWV